MNMQNYIENLLSRRFLNYLDIYKNTLKVTQYDYNKAFINNNWIGTNLCGPSIVVCYNILKNDYNLKNIKMNIYENIDYNDDFTLDHTFMVINENIYVDPTYKQFLKNTKNYSNIFVSNKENLKNIIKNNSFLEDFKLWNTSNNITVKIDKFNLKI
mgnify:CR=1 FL=1